jgi:type IV pilus assembly protein PilF
MVKISHILVCFIGISLLSACVTQNYADEDKPIIQNNASNNEIAMTRISLGLGYLKMGNTTQAKLNLEKAKYYAPNLVEVHTAFAHYYEFVGEPELATASYKEALSIKSDDANTLNNFGVFLCRQGNTEKAETVWLQAVAIPSYTQVSESYENLANCQLQHDNFQKAQTYFTKAIEHSPNNASAILRMTQLLYAKGEYFSAEQYFKRYEKAARRFNAESLVTAYKIYQQQNKTKVAKNYAAMLLKMYPHSVEAKQYILNGLAYTDVDKLKKRYFNAQNEQPNREIRSKKRVVKLSPKKSTTGPADKKLIEHKKVMATEQVNSKHEITNKVINATSKNAPELAVTPVKPVIKNEVADNGQVMMTLPVHIVKSGESLFSISKKYNIRFSNLLRWNHKNIKSVLHIGDVIYLTNPKKAVKNNG